MQVGLKRDVTPQATEPPPTAHDEQTKATEGEEPVAVRTNTNGDIEAGLVAYYWVRGRPWFPVMILKKNNDHNVDDV